MTHSVFVVIAAVLLDQLLGEPPRFHPLAGFGRIAGAIEAAFYGSGAVSALQRRLRGMLALLLAVTPFLALTVLVVRIPHAQIPAQIVLLYLALGARSLGEHAQRVAEALATDALEQARQRVSHMVSRDTHTLQQEDVARATVESVLENGNDAVFGALFWFMVAGVPGVVLYRMVNTLDAMWGYRTPRYLYFGWAAARLDDVLNFVPARLTALTYATLGRFKQAVRCWRVQAPAWESPNAGPVMAAGAGALGIRLGGPAVYHGMRKVRPALGDGDAPQPADIRRALSLVHRGIGLWLAIIALGAIFSA